MQFEVQIPLAHNPQQLEKVVVEAPNWLIALRSGLQKMGDATEVRDIACDIFGENDVRVTENRSGRTFEIREVREQAIQPVQTVTSSPQPTPSPSLAGGMGAKTEAFIPTPNFLESIAAGQTAETKPPAPVVEVSTAPQVESVRPTPAPVASNVGQPVQVKLPTTPPAPVEDEPAFELAPLAPTPGTPAPSVVASNDLLGREDLSFNKTVSVVDPPSSALGSIPTAPEVSTVPKVSTPDPVSSPTPTLSEVQQPLSNVPEVLAVPASKPIETPAVAATPSPVSMPSVPAPVEAPAPVQTSAPIPEPEPTPAPKAASSPSISIGSISGASGKYSPGMTTEILADAFMRAMDIYDYGEDRRAAMNFILELARSNVNAIGGAVLLTDINSPNQELWFEVTAGPKEDQIVNFRIPMGRGIIGFAAKEGVSLLIPDATQDPRFETDVMRDVGIVPGSVLCVPIQHNKRMLGVITLFNQAGARPFTQGELSITNYLAHTAGEYLIRLI